MPEPDDAKPVEVDAVLPPSESASDKSSSEPPESTLQAVKQALPRTIARVLDEWFTISIGKREIRLGLDPILGFFFPAVGDAVSATMGTTILLEGLRRQIPRSVIIRMACNIALNAGVGAIPILGDLFSVWFKSNAQNHALLERHSGNPDHPRVRPNLLPLVIFLVGVFVLIALVLSLAVMAFRALFFGS